MYSLDIYKQVPSKYYLIDYGKPANPYTYNKEVWLTEQEAHDRNQGFALNHTEKRYVKATRRKL